MGVLFSISWLGKTSVNRWKLSWNLEGKKEPAMWISQVRTFWAKRTASRKLRQEGELAVCQKPEEVQEEGDRGEDKGRWGQPGSKARHEALRWESRFCYMEDSVSLTLDSCSSPSPGLPLGTSQEIPWTQAGHSPNMVLRGSLETVLLSGFWLVILRFSRIKGISLRVSGPGRRELFT